MIKALIKGWLLLGIMVSATVFAEGQTPLRHFAEFSTWSQIKLSPNGKYMAGIVDDNSGLGGSKLMVMDTNSKENLHQITITGSGFIADFSWVNNERLMAWEGVKSGIQEIPFLTGNIVAVNWNGKKKRYIFGSARSDERSQASSRRSSRASAELMHRLPKDDRHVLMQVRTWGSKDGAKTRLVKIDVYTGRETNLGSSPFKNASLKVDSEGELRFAYGSDIDDEEAWKFYEKRGDTWQLISRTEEYGGVIIPSAFNDEGDGLYILDSTESDKTALYLYEIGSGKKTLIYEHELVDIFDVYFDSMDDTGNKQGVVAGIWVEPDYPQYIPLNTQSENNKWLLNLQQQFSEYVVTIESHVTKEKSDRELAVVGVRSDKLPGMFLLYDVTNNKLSRIRQAHSLIDASKMRPMEPFKIKVRDGKELYGYLTTPKGEGPFPLIMHPHGGPYGPRDRWGYNSDVQMLASRGYAVVQVNFRGSGGYGKDFQYSAFKQWAGEMQDDLTDTVRWAIKSGIAEEGKVCIYGASYGGYSALMSAVKEPDLYACTAGYVGVYDLALMEKKGDIQRRDEGIEYIREAICDSPESCAAGSPITYIDQLKADVMIIHGKDDQRVPFAHAEVLRDALEARDIPYEWVVKNKEGHGFVNVDNREELYERLLAFFGRNIGR